MWSSIAQMFHHKQWTHWTERGSSAVLYNLKVSLKSKERKSWIFCSVDHLIVQTMQFNSHVYFHLKLVPLSPVIYHIYHLCVATLSSGGKEKHHYKHHIVIIFWWKSCHRVKSCLNQQTFKDIRWEEKQIFPSLLDSHFSLDNDYNNYINNNLFINRCMKLIDT